MRPPPRSIEEWLYRQLIDSPGFNRWVKRVHARINRIPFEEPAHIREENLRKMNVHSYKPTRLQKANAFRVIWIDELKKAFTFR